MKNDRKGEKREGRRERQGKISLRDGTRSLGRRESLLVPPPVSYKLGVRGYRSVRP